MQKKIYLSDADYTAHLSTKDKWTAISGAIIGAFMAILDIQITNSSIEYIAGALSIPINESNTISSAYIIAELISISITAWLTKAFGLRRLLLLSILLFVITSLACSLAWNIHSMVIFRVLQGFAGAPLIPIAMSMVYMLLAKEQQIIGLAAFGITATIAPTVGPTLGGWLTDNFSWKYLFYINIIPAVISYFLIAPTLKTTKLNIKVFKNIDIISLITISVGLGFFEYVLENGNRYNWFESNYILLLFCISIFAFIIFIINDLSCENPLADLKLFKNKRFAFGCLSFFFLGIILYGTVFIVPLYLVQIHNYSALDVGIVFISQGLPQLIFMPLIPLLIKYIDKKIIVIIGYIILAISCYINSDMNLNFAGPQFKICLCLRGIGLPFVLVPLSQLIMDNIPSQYINSATSLISILRNLGGAFGIACMTTLITHSGSVNTRHILSNLSNTYSEGTQWIKNISYVFYQNGTDIATATKKAQILLLNQSQTNGYIIAFNSVFFLLAIFMIFCAFSILFFFDWDKKTIINKFKNMYTWIFEKVSF